MNQGCVHEGKDHRLLGRIGCWFQSRLSFHTQLEPIELSLRFPFYAGLCVPLGPKKFFSIRLGCRWDPNWPYTDGSGRTGGYIFPEAIIKVTDHRLV